MVSGGFEPAWLGDVGRNAPGFVACEQISGRATAGVALEIHIGERTAIAAVLVAPIN
jgi:hypothetical protein